MERFFDYEWHGNTAHKGDKFAGLTPFITTYAWFDQAGGLQQVTYPSGQIVANTYAPGGVTGRISLAGAALFDTLTYAAHGPAESMTLKSGSYNVNWAETFNPYRLWPATVATGPDVTTATSVDDPSVLLGLEYLAEQYENNGNIKQVNRYYRQTAGTTLGTFTFNYGYVSAWPTAS